jgi:hypothetical protein
MLGMGSSFIGGVQVNIQTIREQRKASYMTVYTLTEDQAVKLDLLINKDEYIKEK